MLGTGQGDVDIADLAATSRDLGEETPRLVEGSEGTPFHKPLCLAKQNLIL